MGKADGCLGILLGLIAAVIFCIWVDGWMLAGLMLLIGFGLFTNSNK